MFERFTERARRVVVYAQEEARELSHSYIGTEHLLLGLMRDPETVAARVLRELEVGQDAAREQIIEIVGRGKQTPSGHIPFTPRAKKVLELSLREALQLGHDYIGTEHVLLGLVREGDGVAAQVLTTLAGKLSRVREKVLQLARAGEPREEEGQELSAQLRRAGTGQQLAQIIRLLESLTGRLSAIERRLGIESGDRPGAGGGEPEGGRDEPAGGGDEPAGGGERSARPADGGEEPAAGE